MAANTVTPNQHTFNTASAEATYVTFAASDGVAITWTVPSEMAQIYIKNASTNVTRTAVLQAGNGLQGVSNLSVTVEPSTVMVMPIETGKFKNISGDNKNKVVIKDSNTTSTDLQCKVEVTI